MKSSFFAHSTAEYLMFAEAWGLLAFARMVIFFIPFRKIMPLLGHSVNEETAAIESSDIVASPEKLKSIHMAITRALRRSPWRTKCFEQALAARLMLHFRKIKSVIYFGVKKGSEEKKEERMIAHAWIISSGITVTGGKNNELTFTVVGRFLN
jgi:hypothetical protein